MQMPAYAGAIQYMLRRLFALHPLPIIRYRYLSFHFEILPESFLVVARLVKPSGAIAKQGYMPASLLET